MSDHGSKRQESLREWRAGWQAVLAAGVAIAAGPSFYLYVSSLFVEPVEQAFSWSRSQMMLIAAIPLMGAFVAPIVGRLADRYGIYKVAIPSILLLVIAFLGLSQARGNIFEVCAWMGLLGIAVPGCTGITIARPVVSWFSSSRGLALGVMAALVTIATALLAPPLGQLITTHGFRAGYIALALLALLVTLPTVIFFLREKPVEALASEADAQDSAEALAATPAAPPGIGQVVRQPSFWLLLTSILLTNIPIGGIITQLTPIVMARGIAAIDAGFMLTLYAISALLGRLAIGFLFDMFNAAKVAAFMCCLAILGCLALMPFAPHGLLYLGVLTVGLMHGAEVDVGAFFVARLYPRALFGTVLGWVTAIGMISTAIGVVGFGQLYDLSGSYDTAIALSAVLFGLAVLLFLMLTGAIKRGQHVHHA